MPRCTPLGMVTLGVVLGGLAGWFLFGAPRPVLAGNDRQGDYVICTGMAGANPRSPLDGVWLLDYKSGKLLATVVDRSVGKTTGFAELDLVREFGLSPNQNVHFMMAPGTITAAQAALYLVETTTGKFGVYTMGPNSSGVGVTILRHELTTFRPEVKQAGVK